MSRLRSSRRFICGDAVNKRSVWGGLGVNRQLCVERLERARLDDLFAAHRRLNKGRETHPARSQRPLINWTAALRIHPQMKEDFWQKMTSYLM